MKLRILWNSEASYLSTGYSTYCREILKILYSTGKYDLLEFACYGDKYDKRIHDAPWDIYPVLPDRNDSNEVAIYQSNPINQFGAWKFEAICKDFKPHVVFDFRDFWMMAHQSVSPYRPYYKLVWMPTVDACFPAGTHIITHDGIKNIENIKISDRVLTHDGTYQKVLNTFINPNTKPLVRISSYNSTLPVDMTIDHPVLVIKKQNQKYTHTNRKHRSINHKIENAKYIEAEQVKPGDYVVFPKIVVETYVPKINLLDFSNKTHVKEKNNQLFLQSNSQLLNNEIVLNKDVLEIFGLYIAEGSINSTTSIISFSMNGETEQEYLSKIEEVLLQYFNIKSYRIKADNDKGEEVRVNNAILHNILGNLFGTKANNKKIPEFLMTSTQEQIIPLLEHMFIGDGCDTNSSHNKRVLSYTTVSKTLAVQIFSLLLKLGCLSSISCYKNRVNNDTYTITLFGKHAKKLSQLFDWPDSKFEFADLDNSKSWIDEHGNAIMLVKSVENLAEVPKLVYNFEVENNHTYVTSYVVHNCPQNAEWVERYAQCDAIFTYSDWAIDVLRQQAGEKINIIGSTPPGADKSFSPVPNKTEHKRRFGLEKYKIVGTVMRNQRRKKFPDLMEGFRKYLDKSGSTDTLLYLHTSYPEKHPWDIPQLIHEYGLGTKVLMTYVCSDCKVAKPLFYSDYGVPCKDCGKGMMATSNVHTGVDSKTLAGIYNLFDVYIQYSNSEGFGLPMVEAASVSVPIMAVDYSAMSDVVRKLKGVPLKVKALDRELDTGCYRAVPDTDDLADQLHTFFLLPSAVRLKRGFEARRAYETHYGYDKSANKFQQYFDTLRVEELEKLWFSPPRILEPAQYSEMPTVDNNRYAEWLLTQVLGEPKYLGTYMHARLIKDLNYSTSLGGLGGMYMNEDTFVNAEPKHQEFNRRKAYDHFSSLANMRNHWEQERVGGTS